mgnify:CR=1 FL=1
MAEKMLSRIEPKSVMSPQELAEWEKLAPEVQIERLRDALQHGVDSSDSDLSMDQIWERALARRQNVRVQD